MWPFRDPELDLFVLRYCSNKIAQKEDVTKEDTTADFEQSKTEVYSGHNRLMTTNNKHYFPFVQ